MENRAINLILFIIFSLNLSAQMTIGGEVQYGNEWVDTEKTYYKIPVAEDGLYKPTANDLVSSGLPLGDFAGSDIAVYHNGESIPIHVSNESSWDQEDYLLFEGKKNRSFLDQFMYEGGSDWVLNSDYNLINDTSIYYLTISAQDANRYEAYDNEISGSTDPKHWHLYTDKKVFNSTYHKEYRKTQNISYYDSHFKENEGWASANRRSHLIDFFPERAVTGEYQATINLKLISDFDDHHLSIQINGVEVVNENLGAFELREYSFNISEDDIQGNRIRLEVYGNNDARDRYQIVHAGLTYAQETTSVNGLSFSDIISDDAYYEVEDLNSQEAAWVVNENFLFNTVYSEEVHKINAEGLQNGSEIKVYDPSAVKDANISDTHTFDDINTLKQTDYIILTSDKILQKAPAVQSYKEYRESTLGGNFDVEIIKVENLYDQFAYGVNRHPMAIKNFLYYLNSIDSELEHVFIIGKGIEHIKSRTASDFESPLIQEFRVPSFGYPSSDNLLMSPLNETDPLYSIGRLAYNTQEEISLYLDKVKENEKNIYTLRVEDNLWKKRILHLNGGGVGEYAIIDGQFQDMIQVSENSILNPEVNTFKKTSNTPIQFEKIESIFSQINQGLKYVTFFGHSSSVSLAFDLDREESYENYDQMPFLIALGCSAGNLNIPGESIGEIYGGYKTGGYLGVWASTHYAFISPLGAIGENFYQHSLNNTQGIRLGALIKETLSESKNYRRMTEQMMFMGDPALRFETPQGPDPALSETSVQHEPSRPTIENDSFNLRFSIVNIGSRSSDSVSVDLSHELPDGSVREYSLGKILIPDFRDTMEVSIGIDSAMAGFNYFNVRLNNDGAVEEWPDSVAYENNEFKTIGFDDGYEIYIPGGTVKAVYPMNYAIVPDSQPNIVLSSSPFVGDTTFVQLEVDTTELFNSPMKITASFIIEGGTKTWKIPQPLEEEVVYYWRVKSMNQSTFTQSDWSNYSFTYIEDKTGWNQSHYYQFQDNDFEGMYLSKERNFIQDSIILSYHLDNKIHQNNNGITLFYNGTKLNQSAFWLPRFSGAYVIVINQKSISFASNCPPGGIYGAVNTENRTLLSYPYRLTTSQSRIDMINLLENIVTENQYVIIAFNQYQLSDSFNVNKWQADSLINNNKNIFNVLESYGATKIRKMKTGKDLPYIFIFQKGSKVFAEAIGASEADAISATADFTFPSTTGMVFSPQIHAFKSLEALEYAIDVDDTTDYYTLSMLSENDTLFYTSDSTLATNNINLDSLNIYDYSTYDLQWDIKDKQRMELPQIKYWRLYGDSYGDYTLSAGKKFHHSSQNIRNFDTLKADFYVQNISHRDLDTGFLELKLINEDNKEIYFDRYAIPSSIGAFDSLYQKLSIPIETKSNRLRLQVDLRIPEFLQERYVNNNTLIKDYQVVRDQIGPSIAVFFDGQRIENGDIVSANAEIKVAVTDKSEVIPLSDTSNIEFSITGPEGNVLDYDYFSSNVDFIPADPLTAYLIIQGNFLKEGLYTFKVNASDRSGNLAGDIAYKVQFRIVRENGISYFVNYPNPFSTTTRFQYTLTTKEAPPSYTLMIVNVKGEVVARLDEEQLGTLRVGTHSTLSWNGRMNNGQLLPPGIYFYRLELHESEEFNHIETSYDKYFKGLWGKMLIIR